MFKRSGSPATGKHGMYGLSEEVKVKRKRKVTNQDHIDEKDSKTAICHKDDSVVTTETELSSMKSTLQKVKESLMEKLEILKADTEKKKSKLTEVTQSCKQIESEIKSESQKLRIVIDLQEMKLLDELESVGDKETGQLKTDNQNELIDETGKSDCEMGQSHESGARESAGEADIDQRNKRTVNRISLKSNTEHLIEALNELELGEIEVMYEDGLDQNANLELQKNINVRVAGEGYSGFASDVIVLYVNGMDTIVVTDYHNKSVKSFYTRNKEPCHSTLFLDGGPLRLTKLKHNRVAVTLRDKKQIVTLEVNPDLTLYSNFTTSKQYYGITALTLSTIAVASWDPPSVDILDVRGTIIRSLTPSVDNRNVIRCPEGICATKNGNILVTEGGCLFISESVLCLTPQGDVVFNYSPTGDTALKNPKAVTVTNTGGILVADSFLHTVLQLTESGQFVRNILTSQDGLSEPRGLCIDRHGQLYVCMIPHGKNDAQIKVFSA